MPGRNKHGGKGYKKRRPKDRNKAGIFNPEDGDYYTVVTRKLCDNRVMVKCEPMTVLVKENGETKTRTVTERQVIIPGRMKRRVWINEDTYVCCREDEILWRVDEKTNAQEVAEAKKYCTEHYNKGVNNTEDLFGKNEPTDTGVVEDRSKKNKINDNELDIDGI